MPDDAATTGPLRITDDDATIAAALAEANVPALAATLVHLTGDPSILRPEFRPDPDLLRAPHAGLSDEAHASLLDTALAVISSYRDDPRGLPPQPDTPTVARIVEFCAGGRISEDYVQMMLGELGFTGDAYGIAWHDSPPVDSLAGFHVLVIGAGMSGLCAAIGLERAGIGYTVVERNDTVGGTWLENRYPGCRVDVANHFYSYSFTSGDEWPEHYSQRETLHEYFERCADRFGVRPRIRFGTEVVRARWDDDSCRWEATLRSGGAEEIVEADAIISAVGQLNRPALPDIEGIDAFGGTAFHSACWPEDLDLAGKRVAVVGTGASAIQIVPAIVDEVAGLSVFQRSAPWAAPNPDYHRKVGEGERWLFANLPFYERWYRFALFWRTSDGLWPNLVADPDWEHPDRAMNAGNDAQREMLTAYIHEQLEGRPDLIAKAVPDYPPMGKRFLIDGGWYAALRRDHVELVTDEIVAITPTGIRTAGGTHHEVDTIVFATGFQTHRFLAPMEIVGRSGTVLGEAWGENARAYLGITVPGFPNLFCLYGPNTNLGHGGSIIFHTECQVRYTLRCLRDLLEGGYGAMDCRGYVHDEYNARVDAQHERMIWTHPGMRTWYRNAEGRVTTNSPWPIVEYWKLTREPDLGDYELLPRS